MSDGIALPSTLHDNKKIVSDSNIKQYYIDELNNSNLGCPKSQIQVMESKIENRLGKKKDHNDYKSDLSKIIGLLSELTLVYKDKLCFVLFHKANEAKGSRPSVYLSQTITENANEYIRLYNTVKHHAATFLPHHIEHIHIYTYD